MSKSINTRTRYKIVGSDYSAQEPRLTAFLSGEPKMYDAYNNGKDLYAIIAQSAYHNNYEDNLEFFPEGTELNIDGKIIIAGHKTHLNPEGKKRRATGKILNLATSYGMGATTAGARLGLTGKEATEKGKELLDNFFEGFPKVRDAIENSKTFLKQHGYVEDFIGRRRRLPDISMEPYEAKLKVAPEDDINFNPFIECANRKSAIDPEKIWTVILLSEAILSNAFNLSRDDGTAANSYKADYSMPNAVFNKLKKIADNPTWYLDNASYYDINKAPNTRSPSCRTKLMNDMQAMKELLSYRRFKGNNLPENAEFDELVNQFKVKYGNQIPTMIPDDKMILFTWTGRIAQASRQCFNARVQGSAASLTKIAMVDIYNDQELNDCKAKLIIPVHDELLVECPAYYSERVEKRLPEIMIKAAAKVGDDVPQSCDPFVVSRWYADEYAASILEEYQKLEKSGLSREDAMNKVFDNHKEIPPKAIVSVLTGESDQLEF